VSLESLLYGKGLPANLDAERFVLGSVLLNDGLFAEVAAMLAAEAFSIEKHRRIFTQEICANTWKTRNDGPPAPRPGCL
jgi:replicative DNA helicase